MLSKTTSAIVAAAVAATALSGCAQVRKFRSRDEMVKAPACTDFSFPVYFAEGSAQMPAAALQVIRQHAAQVRACQVAAIDVTGLADASGSAQANLDLSKRRAASVTTALTANGYPAGVIRVAAAGDAGAATAAGDAPLRRRTEVAVRFAAATPGA